MMSIIPVVNFKSCNLEIDNEHVTKKDLYETGKHLAEAMSTVGFVHVTNTGLKQQSLADLRRVAENFMDNPVTEKQKFDNMSYTTTGYISETQEFFDPTQYKPNKSKEGFYCPGQAVFNDETKWPDNLSPGFSTVIKQFMIECKMLAERIMESLSLGMELKEESYLINFHKCIHKEGGNTALRINYYSPCADTLKAGDVRFDEHNDVTTITILFHDEAVSGLQFKHKGKYVDADPVDDAVLIIVGDSFQIKTFGQMKSKQHRVIVPEDELQRNLKRFTFVYCVQPDNDVVLNRPLLYKDEEKNKENLKNFQPPMTSLEYLRKKMEETSTKDY